MSTAMNPESNARGSVWRKWDFHVHTPASFSWEGPTDDSAYKRIIEKINANDTEAVVITDYWTFDGYKKILEVNSALPAEKKLKKIIFPGIELRYDVLTDETPPKRINFQLVIDNSGSEAEVNERLTQIYNRIELNSSNKIISDASFKEIARTYEDDLLQALVSKTRDNCSDSDLLLAAKKHCHVAFESLRKKLLEDKEVRNSFLLIAPWDKYGGVGRIEAILRSDTAKHLLKYSNLVESSKEDTEKLFVCDSSHLRGKPWENSWRQFLDGMEKASVCGSDKKRIDDLGEFPGGMASWIKADASFEGLRQVLFEPKYRSKLSIEKPEDPINTLAELKINFPADTKMGNEGFCLAGESYDIKLSPNLTCFIGGRGTGKSTILELIDRAINGTPNELISKIQISDGKPVEEFVEFDDEEREKNVEFLRQDSIESFATNQLEFTKAIRQRIHKLAEVDNIAAVVTNLNSADNEAAQQIARITQKGNLGANLAQLKKDLRAAEHTVASVKDQQYKDLTRDLSEQLDKSKVLESHKSTIVGIDHALNTILETQIRPGESSTDNYANKIRQALDAVQRVKNDLNSADLASLEKEIEDSTQTVEAAKEKIRDYFKGKGLTQEDLADLSNASKKISDLSSEITAQEQALIDLNESIDEYNVSDFDAKAAAYQLAIKRQIEPINRELSSLSAEVKPIKLDYRFHDELARKELIAEIDTQFLKYRADYLDKFLPDMSPGALNNKDDFIEAIKSSQETGLNVTKEQLVGIFSSDTNFAILKLMSSRQYNRHLDHGVIDVTYDGKELNESSFGQRCTAAIVVLLYLGNNPIIIDEPEAHLDSGLIANYLVGLIKERKQRRQIIFATHNANFVVNGDAELIHVMHTDASNITKIKHTRIEDEASRADLMKLEGSEKAFKQRLGKYGESRK